MYFPHPPPPNEELDQKTKSHSICPGSSKYYQPADLQPSLSISSRFGMRATQAAWDIRRLCKPREYYALLKRPAVILHSRFPLGFLALCWDPQKDRQTYVLTLTNSDCKIPVPVSLLNQGRRNPFLPICYNVQDPGVWLCLFWDHCQAHRLH